MYVLYVLSRVSPRTASHHHTDIARLGSVPLVRVLPKVASSALVTLRCLPALDDTRSSVRPRIVSSVSRARRHIVYTLHFTA